MIVEREAQVIIKSDAEIDVMRRAGRVVGETLSELADMVRPGSDVRALNTFVVRKFAQLGVTPTFKGYQDYPDVVCVSVNEQLVHGIPQRRILNEGDVISIDLGATVDGFVGDAAITVGCGALAREAQRLIDVTHEALWAGIHAARAGVRKGDIGAAIQEVIETGGYGIVRNYVGHGVGRDMHEPPQMPNFGNAGTGMQMRRGMVVALEPMVTMGSPETVVADDGWTVSTSDGTLCAHFEHTLALRDGPADVLTLVN